MVTLDDTGAEHTVTGERYCRAQQEALHASHTYLCLLTSTRNHLALHNIYHGKGERSPEEAAGLVGLRMPTQPGGKGWEK
ncbi:protein FMC1 homolog [Scomber scombrus]|uniref:Protein FMC1 homolog n=1 Tax=Scomber scombrus TaxID=13677 RepID=A0AAV1NLN3_SCOSC